MFENIYKDRNDNKGLKKRFINFKSNKFFKFLNKKRVINLNEEYQSNNNNNNNTTTSSYREKLNTEYEETKNKSLISIENCIKVKEFLKKLDQNSKICKRDEKIKNINQKNNSYDIYRYNMNNCIKLLETSIDNRSNKPQVKANVDYSSTEILNESSAANDKNLLNIFKVEEQKPTNTLHSNNDDESSESDLVSLISKYDLSIDSNKLKKTVYFNPKPSKSSNSSYSCLNAGSKLIELVHNLIKKS